MNCDKRFLGCLQLETCGYALGLLHSGASVAVMVLYLNHSALVTINAWLLCLAVAFWLLHTIASVLLIFGTKKRKAALLVPFIVLYTVLFALVATFAAFCVLEAIASQPKPDHLRPKMSESKKEIVEAVKQFKSRHVPKLKTSGVNFLLLMLVVTFACFSCVYVLSCICSLYDKIKNSAREEKCLPVVGNIAYGAVRESDCSDS